MTDERVTKRDIEKLRSYNGSETESAKIQALGYLAVAQAIDGLTAQVKRIIDDGIGEDQR
jgi:hypothetical protein